VDPYEVLGVPHTAPQAEIDAAYRALCQKYHPDKHENNPLQDLARKKLSEVNAAYEQIVATGCRRQDDGARPSGPDGYDRPSAPPIHEAQPSGATGADADKVGAWIAEHSVLLGLGVLAVVVGAPFVLGALLPATVFGVPVLFVFLALRAIAKARK